MLALYVLIGLTVGGLTGALGGSRKWPLLPTLILGVGLTAGIVFPLSHFVQ